MLRWIASLQNSKIALIGLLLTSSQGVLVKDQELFRYHECLKSVVEENILDNVPSWCENPWIHESNVENETNAKTTCNEQNELSPWMNIQDWKGNFNLKGVLLKQRTEWNKWRHESMKSINGQNVSLLY